jgi:glycosyltransferase involved in cell wall biosynthesis
MRDQQAHHQVVVGLATYRRPGGLARILPLLSRQVRELHGADARVVVVDNAPLAEARDQVLALADPCVTYVHEPRPGIANARNRALDEAGDADALVFIDDDETPQPGWLQALVDCWKDWGCAAVTGPVHPVFDGEGDEWVDASKVFEHVLRETGALSAGAGTNNVLYDVRALRTHSVRFDEDFGLSGGSDTMLAHLLRSKGEEIRWCAEAVVDDYIPAERATRDWVFRRTMRTSNTWARVHLRLAAKPTAALWQRIELTARGGHRLLRGAAGRLLARVTGDIPRDARATVDLASGIGLIMGANGIVRYEYRRTS